MAGLRARPQSLPGRPLGAVSASAAAVRRTRHRPWRGQAATHAGSAGATGQTNDAGMLAWNPDADYFLQMIKDQFDTLYREGAESGRVMCLSLHPHNIGRPNAAKYLDQALRYILGHDGVWNTTADDIAEYYIANYYDHVTSWIATQKALV